MFSLYADSALLYSESGIANALPHSVAQKVAFHTERINSNFDDTLNSLNHAVLLVSATDDVTYTSKSMLHQSDAKEFVQAMM